MHRIAIPLVLLVLGAAVFFVLSQGEGGAGDGPLEQVSGENQEKTAHLMKGQGATRPLTEGDRVEAQAEGVEGSSTGEMISVLGRVTADGVGVAGVKVGLAHVSASSVRRDFRNQIPTEKQDATTETGADGRFAFRLPRDKAARLSLIRSPYLWSLGAPRLLPSEDDLDLGDLAVVRGVAFAGRVVDDHGLSLQGVKVQVYSTEQPGAPQKEVTDASGNFRFPGLGRGRLTLMGSASGLATVQYEAVADGKQGDPFVMRMTRGGALNGVVLDDRDQPIQGARIRVNGGQRSEGKRSEYTSCKTESDAQGKFRAEGLIGEKVSVSVSADGHVSHRVDKAMLADGSVQVQLQRHAILTGVLKDEHGLPLAGSVVSVTKKEPKPAEATETTSEVMMFADVGWGSESPTAHLGGPKKNKTDAEGRFRIEDVAPGKVWVVAKGKHEKGVLGPVTLVPGAEQNDLAMVAKRGLVIEVTVHNLAGDPVEDARVRLSKKSPKSAGSRQAVVSGQRLSLPSAATLYSAGGGGSKSVKTDAEGRCEFGGMKPGEYELVASHKNWVKSERVPVVVGKRGTQKVDIKLHPGGRLRVEIEDESGIPARLQSFVIQVPAVGKKKAKRIESGRTDSTGRALTGPIKAGDYQLVLRARSDAMVYLIGSIGSAKEIGDPVPVRVVDGDIRTLKVKMPKLASLVGTVMSAQGIESGARVSLAPVFPKGVSHTPWRSMRSCRADGEGRFRFDGVPRGTYDLEVQTDGYPLGFQRRIEVAGSAEIRESVVLQTGALTLTAMVGGKPREGVEFSVWPKKKTVVPDWSGNGKHSVSGTTDAQGEARFPAMPPGSFTVRVVSKSFQKVNLAVAVEAGAEKSAAVKLRVAGSLLITCVKESGERWTYFQYEVTLLGAEEKQIVKSWRYSPKPIGALASGRYRVRVRRGGGKKWSEPKVVEVGAEKEAKLEFVCR